MDPIAVAAASGMRARLESLALLANNIANQASPGFRIDRELYGTYSAGEAAPRPGMPAGVAPVIERHWTDLSQGPLRATGNPFDLALQGGGFFVFDGPDGPLLTRNGSLRLSPDGALISLEGYPLRDAAGKAIRLESGFPFEVTPVGEVLQRGRMVAQIAVTSVTDPQQLVRRGGTYFQMTDPAAPLTPAGAAVSQGRLEDSNGASAESAVRLVSVLRQFEMLQKAMQIGGEMSRRADEIARAGG